MVKSCRKPSRAIFKMLLMPASPGVGSKDIPVLQGAVLLVGIIYMVSTLSADLLIAFLNPRVRLETKR